jgi:hypothetical protein
MKTETHNLKEVDLLTSKVLDGLHTVEDLNRLSVLLKKSKDARSRYRELTIQDSMLHWESVEFVETSNSKIIQFPVFSWSVFSSIAAAVVALFGVWWFHTSVNHIISPSKENAELAKSESEAHSILSTSALAEPNNFNSVGKVTVNASDFFLPAPFMSTEETALNHALYGIEVLREKKNFGEGGVVEYNEAFTSWKRSEYLSVPAENGILPMSGEGMLKFSPMDVDVHAQNSESTETLQVVDVRNINSEMERGLAQIQTSVFFNKSMDITGDPTEFSLSFHAIACGENNENASIAHEEFYLESDLNPSTWEELKQDFILPNGTEFVIVSMTARMDGSHVLLPSEGGHYADGLTINVSIDGQDTIGPL